MFPNQVIALRWAVMGSIDYCPAVEPRRYVGERQGLNRAK